MAGMGCFHHPNNQAVATCGCGKGICRDCYDSYGAGMGAGKAMCFNCTEEMVQGHAGEIAWFRKQVKKERTMMIIGAAVVGPLLFALLNMSELGVLGFIFAVFVGASLGTIINGFKEYGAIIGVIMIIVAPIMTIYRFVTRTNNIKLAEQIIIDDANTLQLMRDYFEYTQVMERDSGVDLAKLADQGGELFDNSFARSVMKNGEKGAQAELRKGAVQIAANGEIIRGFDRRLAAGAA